jgi:hypothetical protein
MRFKSNPFKMNGEPTVIFRRKSVCQKIKLFVAYMSLLRYVLFTPYDHTEK